MTLQPMNISFDPSSKGILGYYTTLTHLQSMIPASQKTCITLQSSLVLAKQN